MYRAYRVSTMCQNEVKGLNQRFIIQRIKQKVTKQYQQRKLQILVRNSSKMDELSINNESKRSTAENPAEMCMSIT